mmetsp:Transcript_7425/g.30912  ORF Transcript_7425/g.30912 Transcript_7425/m.30912 type:complete len:217 (-) Transcript_7425:905-1555(-)
MVNDHAALRTIRFLPSSFANAICSTSLGCRFPNARLNSLEISAHAAAAIESDDAERIAARIVPRRMCAVVTSSWKRTRCHSPEAARRISRGDMPASDQAVVVFAKDAPMVSALGFEKAICPYDDRRSSARSAATTAAVADEGPSNDARGKAGFSSARKSGAPTEPWVPLDPAGELAAAASSAVPWTVDNALEFRSYAASTARSTACACARCFEASS